MFGCIIVALSVVGAQLGSGTAANGSCAVTTSSPAGTAATALAAAAGEEEAECSEKHLCHPL